MKTILTAIFLCLACIGCSKSPAPDFGDKGNVWIINGCVIDALAHDAAVTASERLDSTDLQHGVVIFQYGMNGYKGGHAMTAFEWVDDEDKEGRTCVWVWDALNQNQKVKGSTGSAAEYLSLPALIGKQFFTEVYYSKYIPHDKLPAKDKPLILDSTK